MTATVTALLCLGGCRGDAAGAETQTLALGVGGHVALSLPTPSNAAHLELRNLGPGPVSVLGTNRGHRRSTIELKPGASTHLRFRDLNMIRIRNLAPGDATLIEYRLLGHRVDPDALHIDLSSSNAAVFDDWLPE